MAGIKVHKNPVKFNMTFDKKQLDKLRIKSEKTDKSINALILESLVITRYI